MGQRISISLLAVLLSASCACSPAARSALANSIAATATPSGVSQSKLMVFGGENHRTYLGCLNCSQYAVDSLFNQYGDYGSRYSSTSVWNHYNDFGSRYSDHGACNPYANDPPVIVDAGGNFYGRLTLNRYHAQFGYGARLHEWLAVTVCEQSSE